MNPEHILLSIEEAVFSKNSDALTHAVQKVASEKIYPQEILQSLSRGIERAREHFKNGQFSIPDFLLAIDAYRQGIDFLKVYASDDKRKNDVDVPKVVIGVVEGDVHDMGKNIVAAVLEASGFKVYDAGRNVPNDVFIDAIRQTGASILALSTMMSTTLDTMRELIGMARKLFPDIAVIVGGAPFDADLARRIGADGYAENAIAAPDETRRALSAVSSHIASIA
jgi:methanogenic corrinoid protein MtbC1